MALSVVCSLQPQSESLTKPCPKPCPKPPRTAPWSGPARPFAARPPFAPYYPFPPGAGLFYYSRSAPDYPGVCT
jgi:hypothetical protein